MAQVLSNDRQFRYIIMWFNEWSELQRDDFIPVLVEYLTQNSTSNGNGVYMNGLVNSVSNVGITNKPMSLFQCRIKLFREWSCKWPLDLKKKLEEKICAIDPKVGEKVINEIKAYNDTHSNGNGDGSGNVDDDGEVNAANDKPVTVTVNGETVMSMSTTMNDIDDDIVNAAIAVVNATEEAIMSDNRLAAILNNETSVDDDDHDNDNEIENANHAQENIPYLIEPAGQAHEQTEHTIVVQAQNVLNNSAEGPLVA